MTTASQHTTPERGGRVLLGAAGAALAAGVAVVVLGAVVGGSPAAYGALAGTLLAVGVFAFGAGIVHVVSGLVPAASLLVALLTYTLQVVAMAVVFVVLGDSGLLEEALDRRWLAAAVITGTLAWLVAQVVLATRLRIPAYDLPQDAAPEGPADHSEAGAR
jgi:ATP synthase protein I